MSKKEYYKDFKVNQYEDYDNDVFLYGGKVKARYIEQVEPTYRDNILIEALPPIKTDEQIFDEFYNAPLYSEEEKEMPKEHRIQAIYRLMDYKLPLANNYEVQYDLDVIVRRGYVHKKVFSPEYIKKLKETASCLTDDNKLKEIKNMVCLRSNSSNSSSGFSIFGMSGGGKSTTIVACLTSMPQVIIHEVDGFLFTQITWLKIDCTYNGNIKGMCQKFFSAIDGLLGTKYLRMYGKQSFGIDRMIIAMAHLAQLYGLGVLVIDEIQHMRGSKTSNKDGEDLLNFFVSMMNEISLPIIYIGTFKAIKTAIGKDFRHGRRASGIEDVFWGQMEKGKDFDTFIEDIWKYQWLKGKCELTNEIKDLMYEKIMGITDRIIKLFMAIQLNAIISGKEEITPRLIQVIADEKFMITKSMIKALQTKNLEKLAELEDLCSPDIGEMIETSRKKVALMAKVQEIADGELHKNKVKEDEIINNIVVAVSNLGCSYEKAQKATKKVLKQYGAKKDINFLKREVAKELLMTSEGKSNTDIKTTKNRTNKKQKSETSDINEFRNENVKELFDGVK